MKTKPSAGSPSGRHPAYQRLKADMLAAASPISTVSFLISTFPRPVHDRRLPLLRGRRGSECDQLIDRAGDGDPEELQLRRHGNQ